MKQNSNESFKITLKSFFGFEEALASELRELGYEKLEIKNRAVTLVGEWSDVYRLNYLCRCAISVLVEVAKYKIRQESDLYEGARKVNWTKWFGSSKTFAVKGAIFNSIFSHSQYPYLLVKDAVVDRFRDEGEERPNVNVKSPNVMIDLYLQNNEVILSLNTSGTPLFQRGYREATGEAPLNEVVAAGLIRLSGWKADVPFLDPFCGSGTLLIEAAMVAAKIPAGYERTHYAFKNLKNFDEQVWNEILNQNDFVKPVRLPVSISGSDSSDEMVMKARSNARGLGLAKVLNIQSKPFQEIKKDSDVGMIITNPPYGERMGDEIEELYDELGTWMKHEMTGYEAWVISSNLEALKRIGLKPSSKHKVFNGDLECSYRKFELFDGSKKEQILEE